MPASPSPQENTFAIEDASPRSSQLQHGHHAYDAGATSTSHPVKTLDQLAAARAVGRSQVLLHDTYDHHILRPAAPSPMSPATGNSHASPDHVAQGSSGGAQLFTAFPFNIGGARILRSELLQAVIDAFPSKAESDQLVGEYLVHLEWIHHVIDTLAFRKMYGRFWQLAPDRRAVETPPGWLALLSTVLCLALHFRREGESEREESLLQAAQVALSLSNFVFEQSLDSIATITLMGLRLYNRDASQSHQILLAMAIRSAHVLGLHRPDSESQTNDPVQREYGRRLWWSLVCQDSYTSSNINFSYLCQPSQNKSPLPMNLKDADLVPGRPLKRRPRDEQTEMSYQIEKIKFAEINRRFVDLVNTEDVPSYAKVLEIDNAFRAAYDALPTFLHPDRAHLHLGTATSSEPARVYERLFMGFTRNNRLMRLHRPFMARGYEDPAYRFSTDTAVAAARSVFELVQQGRLCSFPGLKWWVVLVHVFTAGLVIVLHIYNMPGTVDDPGTKAQVSEFLGLVKLAIEVLSEATKASLPAVRAVDVLRRLLTELDRRPKSSGAPIAAEQSGGTTAASNTPAADTEQGTPPNWSLERWLEQPIDWDSLLDPNLTFDLNSGSFWTA